MSKLCTKKARIWNRKWPREQSEQIHETQIEIIGQT